MLSNRRHNRSVGRSLDVTVWPGRSGGIVAVGRLIVEMLDREYIKSLGIIEEREICFAGLKRSLPH